MGTHASTMRGISLLKANKIDFHAIAVLTQDSLDFPEEIFNFFLEHEIRKVGFNIDEQEGANPSSSFEIVGVEEQYLLPINTLKMVLLLLQKQCIVDITLRF
jgi:uncharacterized protein